MDTTLSDYFPEIDAVLLVGNQRCPSFQQILKISVSGLKERIIDLGLQLLTKEFDVIKNIKELCETPAIEQTSSDSNYLEQLPVTCRYFDFPKHKFSELFNRRKYYEKS